MHFTFLVLAATALLTLVQNTAAETQFKYPTAPTSNQVDNYNGVKVADPYRPLENPDSPESRAWIEAEDKVTFDFLKTIPERDGIEKRLTEVWDYERFGVPFKEDGHYFFSKNSGLQNQNVLYTTPNFSEPPRQLLDPNLLAKDGTIALGGLDVTEDARLMAYGLATAGSDWQQWKVRDIGTGKDRQDLLDWVKFSNASWKKDGSGFFYSRYDKPDEKNKLRSQVYNHKVFFHRLGASQSQDKLVYVRPDQKEWLFNAEVTDDGRYLIITVRRGTDPKNRIFYKDLANPNSKVVELLDKADAEYNFVDNEGPVFVFQTNLNAPLGRIISIDTTNRTRHDDPKACRAEVKDDVRPQGQLPKNLTSGRSSYCFRRIKWIGTREVDKTLAIEFTWNSEFPPTMEQSGSCMLGSQSNVCIRTFRNG